MPSDRARVVRVDRGALLIDLLVPPLVDPLVDPPVDPAGLADPAASGAGPVRVPLDRDGLVPGLDGDRAAPTVGDVVEVATGPDGTMRVTGLEPRRTLLVRDSAGTSSRTQPLAANVDVVLVVEHLDPDPDLGRVERLLTLAWQSGARPVVVLTKADLVPDPAGMAAEVAAAAPGADVHAVSVPDGTGLAPLRALLTPGTTLVAVGPSGAGKSTLVNALVGAEVMATGGRRRDGRGRHTTTHRELVALPGGAALIDTPGLRGVGVVAVGDALDAAFADVSDLARRCRFDDCSHGTEPGCAVRGAVEAGRLSERRYDSWRRLAREAAYQARRTDARLAALERARVKQRTAEHRRVARSR